MRPGVVVHALQVHLKQCPDLFIADQCKGKAAVGLPDALARKYPNTPTEWGWQDVFPSGRYAVDPRSGGERQHHFDEKLLQRAMQRVVQAARVVIHSPPICRRAATTSAPCRNCSATRTWQRR